MKKLLSLVLVAAMLLSMVAVIPMNVSAADETKLSTEAEAYYFGGETLFNEMYGSLSKPQYWGEEPVPFDEKKVTSKKVLTIDGVIEDGEWGNPSFVADSAYAANNGGFTSKANGLFEEPSADNSYFYYNKNSYKYNNNKVVTPVEKGMSYTVYLMWDEDYLYVAADVTDVTGHMSTAVDSGIWNADAFQFRVDKEGSYTRADGYNADGGKDADGNHVTNYPWKSSVIRGGTEFTSNVPNFIVTYTSSNGGTTIIRDNANRYYPHEVMVDDPDSEDETVMIPETQYTDIDISYAVYIENVDDDYNPIVSETYEDYLAGAGMPTAVAEWGPAYAVAKPVKVKGVEYKTQYEIAIPWEYITEETIDGLEEFGFSTMLLDRQNSLSTSYGAFLEWGNGVNNHRMYHDHLTCNGSNSLTLSKTSFDAREDYHEHDYAPADCTKPETCTVCGHERGFKTGHAYEITGYKLPTTSKDGYANAYCPACGDEVTRTLASATDEVYKWVDRNDGAIDLTSRLSSAFSAQWTQISWSQTLAEGATEYSWTPTAGAGIYNTNGANAGTAKNMLWLPGQTRPEVVSNQQVEVSGIVNPYDFTVLDLTCMSETGTYFHIYDFKGKNSTVSVDVNIWNRLTQAEREMEGETGYNDTLVFWFGPNLIEYAAGLYIIEDKDADGNVTDTKYYFAITPSGLNGSGITIEGFEERALAYKEVDPSVFGIGGDEWHNMTFFVDYDANVALLFWDEELVVGEYDYHFERPTSSTADPILRVFNLELCLTDLYAGGAGLAANYVKLTDSDEPVETEPVVTEPEVTEPEVTEPEVTEPEVTEPEVTEPEVTEPVGPALGSYENPYNLLVNDVMPIRVTVKPGESAYIKASDINNTVVTAGYATSANYMLNYLRFTYLPEGEDNTASFSMIPEAGMDIFSVYNTSETEDVTVYLALTAGEAQDNTGTIDNPLALEFQQGWFGGLSAYGSAELAAASQGYYFKLTAPADGRITVNVSASDAEWNALGWIYCVNNITKGLYGDNIMFDGNPDANIEPTTYYVSAGDELVVFATTFNAADPWNAPAGMVDVNVSFAKEYEVDYPGTAVVGENTANIEAGSQGWYYEWVATEDGKVTVTMPEGNWQYNVSKKPADVEDYGNYYYGDTHWSDDETLVSSETIDVKAGDTVTICVNTYDAANPWEAPAGSITWTLAFEAGSGVLYTLDGEIVGDQLFVNLELSDNDEGLLLVILDFLYNAEALEFVSIDSTNSVFQAPDFMFKEDGRIMIYGEGDLADLVNMYDNGEVFTAVFNIIDPTVDFDFDLVCMDGDEANHANVDENWDPAVVKYTFVTAEDMPENGTVTEPEPPVVEDFIIDVYGGPVDDQLHVYIDLMANPGIWSMGFDVNFNANALELVDVINGTIFADGDFLYSVKDGVISYFACNEADIADIAANGKLIELVFDVKDYDADYNFSVVTGEGNVINANGDDVAVEVVVGTIDKVEKPAPSTVTVTVDGEVYECVIGADFELDAVHMVKDSKGYNVFKNWVAEGVELADATAMVTTFVVPANDVVITSERYLHGDVNNDGKINALDTLTMTKITKKIQSADGCNADVNFDNKINALDNLAAKKVNKKVYDYSQHEVEEA